MVEREITRESKMQDGTKSDYIRSYRILKKRYREAFSVRLSPVIKVILQALNHRT